MEIAVVVFIALVAVIITCSCGMMNLVKICGKERLKILILYELSHRGCDLHKLWDIDKVFNHDDVGTALHELQNEGLIYEYSGRPYKLENGAMIIPRMFRIKRRKNFRKE